MKFVLLVGILYYVSLSFVIGWIDGARDVNRGDISDFKTFVCERSINRFHKYVFTYRSGVAVGCFLHRRLERVVEFSNTL
jgi:hypothetical protein